MPEIGSQESIILKQQDFREGDLLVTFLTPEKGRLKGIARGAKKLTGRGVGRYEPMTRGTMYFSEKSTSDLVSIRKCDPLPPYLFLQEHYEKFLLAGYFAELMVIVPISQEDAALHYALLLDHLNQFCGGEDPRHLIRQQLVFEWDFLGLLGLQPLLNPCVVCQRAVLRPLLGREDGAGKAAYQLDLERAGFRCPDCLGRGPQFRELSGSALNFLKDFTVAPTRSEAKTTRKVYRECLGAITPFLVRQLGREPRSLSLLAGI